MKITFKNKLILGVAAVALLVTNLPTESMAVVVDEFTFGGDFGGGSLDLIMGAAEDPYTLPSDFPKKIKPIPVPDTKPPRSKPDIKKPLISIPADWPTDRPPTPIRIKRPRVPAHEEPSTIPGQPPVQVPEVPERIIPYKWKPSTDPRVPGEYIPDLPVRPKPTTRPTTTPVPEPTKPRRQRPNRVRPRGDIVEM
jgi:hypothetical protein